MNRLALTAVAALMSISTPVFAEVQKLGEVLGWDVLYNEGVDISVCSVALNDESKRDILMFSVDSRQKIHLTVISSSFKVRPGKNAIIINLPNPEGGRTWTINGAMAVAMGSDKFTANVVMLDPVQTPEFMKDILASDSFMVMTDYGMTKVAFETENAYEGFQALVSCGKEKF